MNLEKYQELSGITVSESKKNSVKAQIRRTRIKLETMLGFTLDRSKINTNFYNEVGKSRKDCFCLSVNSNDELLPADKVQGSYRLFSYNDKDRYFEVDPFINVYSVKLVRVRPGDEDGDGVTIKTFDKDKLRIQMGRDGIGKYIETCKDCMCNCDCENTCSQLAVDADWVFEDCLPEDILFIWADMVTQRMNPKYDVKSESITGHSYTKYDRVLVESEPENLAIIQRYAGPNGTVSVMPT